MLARMQMFLARGTEFQRSINGRLLSEQTVDQWLGTLDAVDVEEIEFARSQFLFARDDVGKERHDRRRAPLANRMIRSEEKAVLLQQLGELDFFVKIDLKTRDRDTANWPRFGARAKHWFRLAVCEERCGRPDAAIIALEKSSPSGTSVRRNL